MRITDLTKHGFSMKLVNIWKEAGIEYLLPLQVEAFQQYGLLNGKNLLVSAPTSAGKTFCGELAALRAVSNNRRAIILVPLKALASEKYFELTKRYRKIGLNIIVVTSDYPENRRAFLDGRYDIAVLVYEMFNSLTVTNLSPLEGVGVFVCDEFQLIDKADRGLVYELAISKIRSLPNEIQVIGLIGGLDDCELFASWLKWPLLKSTTRPVELHRGVLCDGKYYFRRYNDCREGMEYFTGNDLPPDGFNIPTELFRGLKYLLDKNEQALIFTATRQNCFGLAIELASILTLPPAENVLNQLEDIPDTLQKADLQLCLKHGLGFHNADLCLSLRRILENGFRDGSIRVLVSTSTLGMGVNFPSKNVFIEAIKCYNGPNGQTVIKPLVMYDYNQMAGRAGRLGHTDDFGRAIFIASDDTRREVLWESYIYGCARPNIEPFDTEHLAELMLRWICCGLVRDHNDASELFAKTLRHQQAHFKEAIPHGVLELLNTHGFLEMKGCRFGCTLLGRAVAAHNISLSTALLIKSGFANLDLADNFLSWLYYLLDTPDGRKITLRRKTMPYLRYDYSQGISGLLNYFGETPAGPLADLLEKPDALLERSRLETFFLLSQIIQPVPTIELEARFNIGWGRIKRVGETVASLFLAAAQIAGDSVLSSNKMRHLLSYADRLYWGVPDDGLPLAHLKVALLERDFIFRLTNSGLYSASDIVSSGLDIVASILPGRVAESLYNACQEQLTNQQLSDEVAITAKRPPLIAKRSGERFEVQINGVSASLQPRQYSYLCRLYNCDHPEGWLDKNYLDSGDNQVKYFYNLKKALAGVPGLILESDGAGKYRLRLTQEINGAAQIPDKQPGAYYGWG